MTIFSYFAPVILGVMASAMVLAEPTINIYEKAFRSLEGFRNVSVDTTVSETSTKCYVQEKALLTKTLLALSNAKIPIEEDGRKADAVLIVGVATEMPHREQCISYVSMEVSMLGRVYFERNETTKIALVPLFRTFRLVGTPRLEHSDPVEKAVASMADEFVYKWTYFNNKGK